MPARLFHVREPEGAAGTAGAGSRNAGTPARVRVPAIWLLPGPQHTVSTKFHIRTYGCQMNERDSEALACRLAAHGFVPAAREEEAEVLLFNTCSVRDQAERKVLGKVGLLKRRKRAQPDLIIGIIGCMAQHHGEQLLDKLPHVDLVLGTDQLHRLPELVAAIRRDQRARVLTEPGPEVLGALRDHVPGQVTASVAVMRGCNEFCSYCIVPYVRGREKSRPLAAILDEIRCLVESGTREILLLGQNITAYGLDETASGDRGAETCSPFADLLRAANDVPGVARIRFTSPHPKYMNRAFLDAVVELPAVCKAFHIPLQSGSDAVLERMRRGYRRDTYLELAAYLKARLPEVALSTDIIVGFPGETEADFAATRELMATVGFDMAYIFKYSARQGTAAARRFPDDVPHAVKEERNRILLAELETRVERANRRFRGRTVEMLVEGPSRRNPARWTGRSQLNKVCLFAAAPAEHPPGSMRSLRVTRTTARSLCGTIEEPSPVTA